MKKETATKFLSLTENGRSFNIEETDEGLAVSWDFSEDEEKELVELEYPGTAPELIKERFYDLVKEIIHASIEHAKNTISSPPGDN
jgi:hypothetical protein